MTLISYYSLIIELLKDIDYSKLNRKELSNVLTLLLKRNDISHQLQKELDGMMKVVPKSTNT